ncbi:MAG TPA: MraY family glycosyltransferase [Thermoanaerobaculaceae bacterium]|nr:MraY family glycosyltransferase [Thermoanaerobaculaceae bacterium]
MPDAVVAAILSAVIAGVVTSVLVPVAVKVALALRAVDYPGERKLHRAAVPRLGGLAIAAGLACGAGAVALMKWNVWGVRIAKSELAAVLVGCAIVFLVGLVDDVVGVSTPKKFLAEIVAAALIAGIGWKFTVLGLPGGASLKLGSAGAVLTIVWIVGVTNAINLLDGLDGLASGVVAIIAASLLVYSLLQENAFTVVLMAGVVGACLGFLRHNRAPAQIFMGDSGALSLGFLLAVVSVHSSLKSSAAIAILVPILALGVPVMDTVLVMLVRFLEEPKGRSADRLLRMFSADRNHLHHLMARHGASRRTIVRVIYALVFVACVMAMVVGLTKDAGLGIGLVLVQVMAVLLVRTLGFSRQARALSEEAREEMRKKVAAQEGQTGPIADP